MCKRICVCLLLPALAAGQVSSAAMQWVVVERIATGERVEVELSSGKRLKGTIDHVTAEAAYARIGRQTVEVQRDRVKRLHWRKHGHGARWATIGAAVGAGGVGAAGAAIMEKKIGYGGAVAGMVGLGALLGAGIGYGLGHGKSVLLYEAPRAEH